MQAGWALASGNGPGSALASRTILLVEDEELVRETISGALEDAGYMVLEVETAEAGLGILETQPVDLLFTDIRLPGAMDGWRLAEEARSLNPELPVIYATGFTAEAPRIVRGGIFLKKPYLPSAVIAAIEKLVGTDPA